jgi:hypothetical protein
VLLSLSLDFSFLFLSLNLEILGILFSEKGVSSSNVKLLLQFNLVARHFMDIITEASFWGAWKRISEVGVVAFH